MDDDFEEPVTADEELAGPIALCDSILNVERELDAPDVIEVDIVDSPELEIPESICADKVLLDSEPEFDVFILSANELVELEVSPDSACADEDLLSAEPELDLLIVRIDNLVELGLLPDKVCVDEVLLDAEPELDMLVLNVEEPVDPNVSLESVCVDDVLPGAEPELDVLVINVDGITELKVPDSFCVDDV